MEIKLIVTLPEYGMEMRTTLPDEPIIHSEAIGKWVAEAVTTLKANLDIGESTENIEEEK